MLSKRCSHDFDGRGGTSRTDHMATLAEANLLPERLVPVPELGLTSR